MRPGLSPVPRRLERWACLGCLALSPVAFVSPPAIAQEAGDEPAAAAADSGAVADSVSIADSASISPVLGMPAADMPTGPSPMGAFFRSVLVPGWGQLAADQPVRAAFYFTAQAATVFMVFRTQSRLNDATSEGLKESRREQREDWLVLAGFWALASGIDAWVSAQMWGFEGEVVPPPDGSAGLAVRYRVPTSGF